MAATIRGNGTLMDIGKTENLKYAVGFEFQGIETTTPVPGLPPETVDWSYSGQVWRWTALRYPNR
jgi:hypothetical protein